ncbi:MAG: hypothetical protein J07HR59_01842 [Halorubrum sp. J07HR59]|nr:MAG: hypothetical protein J07HR59_01842 [Halorubrum sp. J07HR59]
MAWHGPACEVAADIHASHTLHWVRRMTYDPQPRPRWFRSGCLRGRRNDLLSHDGILADARGGVKPPMVVDDELTGSDCWSTQG